MKHTRVLGFLILIISLSVILSQFSFNPTGNLVRDYFSNLTFNHIITWIFLALGLILLAKREGLEYLVIPVGLEKWQKPKAKNVQEVITPGRIDRVVITGDIAGEKRRYKKHDEDNPSVYDAVRKAGIKPSHIKILRGLDSEEDILYLGEIVKPGDTIYFDTFPLHFKEYTTLVKKAQRDGKFPENVDLRNEKIPQGKTEIAYGIMGWLEEVVKRRPLSYKKNRESGLLDKVKGIVKKVIGA